MTRAAVEEYSRRDPVRQLSIFIENRVGRLHELMSRLAAQQLHILAFSQLENTEVTIVRVIVDYPEVALDVLEEHGYAFTETHLVAVELPGEVEFVKVTAALVQAEINIHYIYAFVARPMGRSALALHVEDADLAASILATQGLKVLDHGDIAR